MYERSYFQIALFSKSAKRITIQIDFEANALIGLHPL